MKYLAVLILVTMVMVTCGYEEGPKVYDMCKQGTIQVSNYDQEGYIIFNRSASSSDSYFNPCVVKIQACAVCQVEVTADMTRMKETELFCGRGNHAYDNIFCTIDCNYIRVFDMYYNDSHNHVYGHLSGSQPVFRSESSTIFISFCHGYDPAMVALKYKTIRKLQNFEVTKYPATFSSPMFPKPYAQNHETYEYQLTAPFHYYIKVTIDDWNLNKTSSLYFEDSDLYGPVTGAQSRPTVVSNSNHMRVIFHTGVSVAAGLARNDIGFSATYVMIPYNRGVSKPNTDCVDDGYHFTKTGGVLDISMNRESRADCIYVIKPYMGYDGMYLKILNYNLKFNYAQQTKGNLTIYRGITSKGWQIKFINLKPEVSFAEPLRYSGGFYMRLKALFTKADKITVAYASYKNISHCRQDPDMFLCGTGRCIDKSLMCDSHDHCGDRSDEANCRGAIPPTWDHANQQYELTVSVIIPIVICVFLIMVICLLFVAIRRCRNARLREAGGQPDRVRTLSEAVVQDRGQRSNRGGGRRRRRRGRQMELDLPPSYDEAMENPPSVFYYSMHPSISQPPSYDEAMNESQSPQPVQYPPRPVSPSSTDSSQSELTAHSHNQSMSSSSSDDGSTWDTNSPNDEGRRQRRSRHVSSSESDTEILDQSQEHIVPSSSAPVSMPTSSSSRMMTTDSESGSDLVTDNLNKTVGTAVKADQMGGKQNGTQPSTTSQFIIPSGHKPEGETDRTLSRAPAAIHEAVDASAAHLRSTTSLASQESSQNSITGTGASDNVDPSCDRRNMSRALSPSETARRFVYPDHHGEGNHGDGNHRNIPDNASRHKPIPARRDRGRDRHDRERNGSRNRSDGEDVRGRNTGDRIDQRSDRNRVDRDVPSNHRSIEQDQDIHNGSEMSKADNDSSRLRNRPRDRGGRDSTEDNRENRSKYNQDRRDDRRNRNQAERDDRGNQTHTRDHRSVGEPQNDRLNSENRLDVPPLGHSRQHEGHQQGRGRAGNQEKGRVPTSSGENSRSPVGESRSPGAESRSQGGESTPAGENRRSSLPSSPNRGYITFDSYTHEDDDVYV